MVGAGGATAAPATYSCEGPAPLEWHFLQCFGERTPGEEVQEGKSRTLGSAQYRQSGWGPAEAAGPLAGPPTGPHVCLVHSAAQRACFWASMGRGLSLRATSTAAAAVPRVLPSELGTEPPLFLLQLT
jgi:hypothetical protein